MDTDETPAEQHGQAVSTGTSILDDVAAMRREKAEGDERQLDLNVPGYEDRLAVIYRYPPEGYARAVSAVEHELEGKGPNARIEGACDLLAAACAAIAGRDGDGKLIDPVDGTPVADGELPANVLRFDAKLAERLKMEVPAEVKVPARFIVRSLFSPRAAVTNIYDGDLSLISQSNVVFAWLNGSEVKRDDELVGE